MKRKLWVPLLTLSAAAGALAQQPDPPAAKQLLQQRIAQIKESMAQNQAALKQYSWVETTDISLKGEVKKHEQKNCAYGPDGKVQKTPVGEASVQQQEQGGGGRRGRRKGRLKGKAVEKKVAELKDYGERFGSLIKRYAPPDPEKMKAAFQNGAAGLERSSGGEEASLVFHNYVQSGDQLSLTFDTAAKKLRSYDVKTYLDDPEDVVTLSVLFKSLPDGTNYMSDTVLESAGKQLQIKMVNVGHKKTP
jgi:hypothetical protein